MTTNMVLRVIAWVVCVLAALMILGAVVATALSHDTVEQHQITPPSGVTAPPQFP